MRPLSVLVLLLSSVALAQGKPTLVDYPLDVKAPIPAAKQEDLQSEFRMLLAKNPAVLLSTKSQWKAAVGALKRQDCDVRDECLQQLAVSAGTLYAIYASVEQNAAGTEVTATGRVVNMDLLVARALELQRAEEAQGLVQRGREGGAGEADRRARAREVVGHASEARGGATAGGCHCAASSAADE